MDFFGSLEPLDQYESPVQQKMQYPHLFGWPSLGSHVTPCTCTS
uniref:Uncharacterized protein n=1 Tax=Arundo donax TaxID=35708 RepID=A0A0A8ZV88_ARUDO